ncbi:MAG TPA: carboxypeptidase-like regulatory domain-containing protein, partial [Flavitalea sp.]|nr:carboxypeptidase-like regulatory domain-containing protein [Flavitalea sp.]
MQKNNNTVIRHALFLLYLLHFTSLFGQSGDNLDIKGIILNAKDNSPVSGVSITSISDKKMGTTSDNAGKFTLNLPAGTQRIIVT